MAGATVLRGIEGFCARGRLHTARILRSSEDLPLIIEIVDTEEEIAAVLPAVEAVSYEAAVLKAGEVTRDVQLRRPDLRL